MEKFIIIFLSFAIGYSLKHVKTIPENMSQALNSFIIYVSIPALVFLHLPSIDLQWNTVFPISMAWVLFGLGFIFFQAMARLVSMSKKVLFTLFLCAGLGNTSFLGFAMIEVYFGKDGLPIGILCDAPGTFLVLSVLGIPMALSFHSELSSKKEIALRILKFPPFLAFCIGILLNGYKWPVYLEETWKVLGGTLVPLALFSIGFRLEWKAISGRMKYIFMGLGFKMILAPICIWFYLKLFGVNDKFLFSIIVFESAMPPMVTAAIVASENELDSELASLLVSLGILFSILSLYFWYRILV